MAELFEPGWLQAPSYEVFGDPDAGGVFTKPHVRRLLGVEPEDKVLGAVVYDPDTRQRAGFIFFRPEAEAIVAAERPNLRGGMLVGKLLYGPVVLCTTADRVDW